LTDIKVIQPDFRGHGESSKDADISMKLLTEDIIHILDQIDVKKVNILGFSMGSLIAQNLALEFPERVKSLIICSGYSSCNHELFQTFRKLEELTGKGGIPVFFDEMIKLVYTKEYLLEHGEIYKFREAAIEMNSQTAILKCLDICRNFDVESELPEIRVPTFIMCGSEDLLVPPENSKNMQDGIKNSELLSFPTGHNFFLQENIEKLAMEIQRFLLRI
jgi:pimeloyl-ACP methyl ester carboxylesterase